jgi:dimethylamine/trimethylamine dehydrogenase
MHTLEQEIIQADLLKKGIKIIPHHFIRPGKETYPEAVHIYTGESTVMNCDALLLVTARLPNASLETELGMMRDSWGDAGIKSVTRIGDALAPSTIAAAVYSGHRYARELDEKIDPDAVPFDRELTNIAPEPDWNTFWQE